MDVTPTCCCLQTSASATRDTSGSPSSQVHDELPICAALAKTCEMTSPIPAKHGHDYVPVLANANQTWQRTIAGDPRSLAVPPCFAVNLTPSGHSVYFFADWTFCLFGFTGVIGTVVTAQRWHRDRSAGMPGSSVPSGAVAPTPAADMQLPTEQTERKPAFASDPFKRNQPQQASRVCHSAV